ncbi:polysaccharide biosynthesis/export family protein [Rhodovulum sp. DZ06]|uniref:polysaccharide biosynthesis/export family protein n=1 Tax=Rhodovulum sp. DZ06 TaxID=3425126 RepID=UPI003D3476BF
MRGALLTLLALVLAACATPRGGPTPGEIAAPPLAGEDGFALVHVTDAVARAAAPPPRRRFPDSFLAAEAMPHALIARGERLRLRIWESVDRGVYSAGDGPRASDFEVQVDEAGRIFVPYAGHVPAAGRSLDRVRASLSSRLGALTRDPQVEISRPAPTPGAAPEGERAALVLGEVAQGGVRAITRDTGRILGMLAAALGPVKEPATLQITLRRGAESGKVWLREIYEDPALNVALRPGDAVIVDRDRRAFTGLGAVSAPQLVPFPAPEVTALEALGLLAGLDPAAGDPTGIFVFRTEAGPTARAVAAAAGATPPAGEAPVRTAYLLDLTRPGGMFTAGAFQLRDGDTVYVTDAPAVRWIRVLNALAPAVNFVGSARSLAGG